MDGPEDERISILVQNRHFIDIVEHVRSIITKAKLFRKNLLNLEDSLLRLSNGHAEGLFYGMILKLKPQAIDQCDVYQIRYFETGSLEGFFEKNNDQLFGHPKKISTANAITIPWKVFTSNDIDALESAKCKTKGTYVLITTWTIYIYNYSGGTMVQMG